MRDGNLCGCGGGRRGGGGNRMDGGLGWFASPPSSWMIPLKMLSIDGLPPPPRVRSDADTGDGMMGVASRP